MSTFIQSCVLPYHYRTCTCTCTLCYEQGRVVSSIKSVAGLAADSLNSQTVSVCGDTVAVRNSKDEKCKTN